MTIAGRATPACLLAARLTPRPSPLPATFTAKELAAFLRVLADRIDAGDVRPGALAALLTGADERPAVDLAADYIDTHRGAGGKDVAGAARVTHEHFRRAIAPDLKARGYANQRPGWYAPGDVAQRYNGATSALHTPARSQGNDTEHHQS